MLTLVKEIKTHSSVRVMQNDVTWHEDN
jgi:hypothetical protein